jgi:hypothetical protein
VITRHGYRAKIYHLVRTVRCKILHQLPVGTGISRPHHQPAVTDQPTVAAVDRHSAHGSCGYRGRPTGHSATGINMEQPAIVCRQYTLLQAGKVAGQ